MGRIRNALSLALHALRTSSTVSGPSERRGLFGITFGVPGAETWGFANAFGTGARLPQGDGIAETVYASHATVATACGTIAEDAASIPWEAWPAGSNRDADDPFDEHQVLDLWEKPNPFMTGDQLFVGSYLSDLVFGETFWYYPDVVLNRPGASALAAELFAGVGSGLWLLDPRRVVAKKVDASDEAPGGIGWFLKRPTGQEDRLDVRRLTHFKRWNPYDHLRGLSKLTSLLAEIEGDAAAADWNRRFFAEQNGIPSGLLIPNVADADAWDDEDQRREILRTWNQKHGGRKRSVGLLPAGWEWKDLGIRQRDMDFRRLREYSREAILGLIGVPPFRAGVLDKANYANAREQDSVYWNGTIIRFVTRYQKTINVDFLPKLGVEDVEMWPKWEVVKAMLEDLKGKVEAASKLWEMGVPLDQLNERLELGFDTSKIPTATESFVPSSMLPSAIALTPVTVTSDLPDDDDGNDEPFDDEDEDGSNKRATLRLVKGASRESKRAARWKSLIALTRDLDQRFESTVRAHFHNIEQEVIANVHGTKAWINSKRDDVATKAKVDDLLFDKRKAKRQIRTATAPLYRETMKRGGTSVIAEIGFGIVFDMENPTVLAKLAEMSGLITRIDETVEFALRGTLLEGLQAGEGVGELAKRVTKTMGASKTRAATIARTETGFAFSSARNLSMRQAGIKKHEWLSSRDPAVRDAHGSEDGNVVKVGDRFPVTGLHYPHDSSGAPEQTINCRCIALPVTR